MSIRIDGTNTTANPGITGADADTGLQFGTDEVSVVTGGTERVKVDSSGQVGIGTASPNNLLTLNSNTANTAITIQSSDSGDAAVVFGDQTDFSRGRIKYENSTDALTFETSNLQERMRIQATGNVLVAQTSGSSSDVGHILGANGSVFHTRSGAVILILNRLTNDGELVQFRQAGSTEGNITVSGSTVSYNGAHLSRWSQLPGNAERTEILRGSVLSNLDEMCEWGEENNEQLNRMKVSDVEGDPNVSGVFQAWDDDDDTYTNDFYCAMTGDFVIRIAQGTTVARGDLLMSAGDGTAKPQGDDIVRSKTIAKVTSTTVSCTYDDGSYCVPCVLMAC